LGLYPTGAASSDLVEALRIAGFCQESSFDTGSEALVAARERDIAADWWIAAEPSGRPNLELVYCLPHSLNSGPLDAIISAIERCSAVQRASVFIYDLGTANEEVAPEDELKNMRNVLEKSYEVGGPLGSVYHSFSRSK
jgi:hypothetical protein